MYRYELHPEAQKEYEAAVQWYRDQSLVAAENFVLAINEALFRICQRPTWWRNTYLHYHELGLKKYPYSIIYTIEPAKELVVIIALFHHKQNPAKKYRKT
ncbi:ParE toxin of type II toxin-antitoxin system, parDE [Cnuella takakiae]|uniref:ParE toxin of type II toxin-antitoxin system, parDE n=1 Tax=Cnuella takakiae TaxID=1302690 RepID=A0A1M5AHD4_9BACT|nr:type II toxin-antitoxin system RelE/ParE family toxin [Cnuella takakiae]OLY91958.1 hypothetical protein BUE76_08670 [Cnuella takakiae]SHF29699.1 ParE toxin of type II toxin-antitoxin system, parDE [Cnuella takakiae]